MRVVTAAEMKKIDQLAVEQYGIPGIILMENAGLRAVEVIESLAGPIQGKTFTILVGKGNNGGDGLVVARHLHNKGARVKLLLAVKPDDLQGDARINLNIWQKMSQPVFQINQTNGINVLKMALLNTHMVVDALFGTGFRGRVNDKLGQVMNMVNASPAPVISIDIPSGLEADTGRSHGPCIRAAHTVTFGLPKVGLVLEPGATYAGTLHIVDISLPKVLTESSEIYRQLLTAEGVAAWFAPRKPDSHKGIYGRVLVVAGCRGMVGAARLASMGALRAGAGLVTLALPGSLQPVAASQMDEVMTLGLPETGEGSLAGAALDLILERCQQADALVLGPGIGTEPETRQWVQELLPQLALPSVIDADGLNALAGAAELWKQAKAPMIITPHPGELSRLLNTPVQEIQKDRIETARDAAHQWKLVTVLKGAGTVIATPDGDVYINPTGNPGMATGGSGDILAGMTASLLAQGFQPERAAAAAVYLHGLAGDLAARELGQAGMIAGDILRYVPAAFKSMEEGI
ncbi:bifunctional ADP-dependent NAD(P)H-hydrate dehydratase/NAD(P)H-hydrate epimerase [Desulforamulus ruminis]|uniref:Bifunctional NAD(P)H-hydrate repair enzyme n=1 Tax=Desulforamulus ruminis (strain ATCC 23193 / DSM 2154 / NCIMB 8452 / DL) TaxID=696281 RepID=F6DUI1_DESRL|nr:bifunctional ADP-dependent NAD(P)H-hydrate dehydratase/NAD(P)H-hydrate epimerase [Desulforamulus ruminis]AEG59048.1 carbohydrate kinase, YjeF related protein [Desulforamulus ruminis DSM 2154]